MEIQCQARELKEAVRKVSGFIPAANGLPILNNVLITAERGKVKVMASDTERWIIARMMGADIKKPGAVCLPAKALTKVVCGIPDTMSISTRQKGKVAITWDKAEVTLNAADAADYPRPVLPKGEGNRIKVDADVLLSAIERTIYATTATEWSRPALNAILMEVNDNQATFAATDGFRLAVQQSPVQFKGQVSVLLPRKTMELVAKILKGNGEGKVVLAIRRDKTAVIIMGNVEVITNSVEGTFPNYQQLIPQSWTTKVTWLKDDIMPAIQTIDDVEADVVRVLVGETTTTLSSKLNGGDEGHIEIKLFSQLEGEPGKIAVNPKYLRDAVKRCGYGKVSLEFTAPSAPMVIKPVDDDCYSVTNMPMFVDW